MMQICGKEVKVRGGLLRIASPDADKYEALPDPDAMLAGLRKCGQRIDLFTFMQVVSETEPKYKFPMEMDNVAALPISTFDQWWNKVIDGKTRNMIRKGEKKGVTVREVPFDDALVQGIWEIYNECPVRQGRPFPHYGKDVETIRRISATFPDTSMFIGAFFEEKLIGFVKLTSNQERTQAGIMHIVAMIKHRDKSPTNALLSESVRACANRGIANLVYSNFAYGKKQRDTLSDFKVSNGFRRVDLPRYYVPLTALGSMAFRLGFHHSLHDHVPATWLAKFRELRTAWYNRKPQSVTQAS